MDSELRKVDLMTMTDLEKRQRSAAIEEAKSWLGTPFHHMARVKGRKGGVDCGQFLLGVFGPVGVIPPFEPEPYVQQFALHNSREWYLEYLSKLATEIPEEQALEGDVVIYKVGRCFSHAAILTGTVNSIPNTGQDIKAADFNGDGYLDIAISMPGANAVRVMLGNGSGSFSTGVSYTVGTTPYNMSIGDFNGDGKPDIIVANRGGSNVSVLLNNGSGGFGTAANYNVGTNPYSVTTGDFNKDGILDFATANIGSSNVSIAMGLGSSSTTNILSLDHTAGVANGAVKVPALMLKNQQTPATSSDNCIANTMVFDSNYIYICTAANTWKRATLSTF